MVSTVSVSSRCSYALSKKESQVQTEHAFEALAACPVSNIDSGLTGLQPE